MSRGNRFLEKNSLLDISRKSVQLWSSSNYVCWTTLLRIERSQ